MTATHRPFRFGSLLLAVLALVSACPFDESLREYLSAHFWLPFAKRGASFERPHVRRISAPFAGMADAEGTGALGRLRSAYRQIAHEESGGFDEAPFQKAVAEARADSTLTTHDREEVDLIDAKIDLRAAGPDDDERLETLKKKLGAFLRTARAPELRSEARGWLARVHYLLGEQAAAGKIYIDELNRNGSNLSRETLLNSLAMTYGYDGGQILDQLEEYFDTPEHAAFAIQLATNPHRQSSAAPDTYRRIQRLVESHGDLLGRNTGAGALALLSMRTALRMGDPPAASRTADAVPTDSPVREEPDSNGCSPRRTFCRASSRLPSSLCWPCSARHAHL